MAKCPRSSHDRQLGGGREHHPRGREHVGNSFPYTSPYPTYTHVYTNLYVIQLSNRMER